MRTVPRNTRCNRGGARVGLGWISARDVAVLNFGLATPKAACDLDRVVRPRLPLKRQATARGLIVDTSELGDVEAIEVHDLVPGCDEVVHKFLLRVRASVNF